MSNQDTFAPFVLIASHLHVYFRDQRANRVEHAKLTPGGLFTHGFANAVGAENYRRIVWHFVEFIDENRTFFAQTIDHVLVVHYLVTHVDRPAVDFERFLDNADGAIDAGAEAAGVSEVYIH